MDFSSSNEEFDTDSDDYDVIVIGGGLTGLSAANNILKKHANLSLMIIEAEDSIGGRLKSSQHFKFFSHSFQSNFRRLLEELAINIEFGEKNDGRRIVCGNDGRVDRSSPIVALQVYYCMTSLNEASLNPNISSSHPSEDHSILAEVSVAELINQMVMSSEAKLICSSVISLTCGLANLENISALWLLTVLHGAGGLFQRLKHSLNHNSRYFIKDGLSTLLQRLRDKILLDGGTVNCAEEVTAVDYNEYRNFVRTSKKTYKCSYLIVAVPPPQVTRINFEPVLPETHTIQSLYTVTPLIYFEAKYKRNFWHPECSGSVIVLANSGYLRVTHDVTHPPQNQTKTLAGFFSASGLNESQRIWELSQTLTKCFNVDEPDSRTNYHEENLDSGVMSVFGPCHVDCHVNPMKKPYKRIFFAASEYAKSWPGTADGAVEAGEHAACLVLHHARPQALSRSQILSYVPLRVKRTESNYEVYVARTILLIANAMIFWTFLRRAYDF